MFFVRLTASCAIAVLVSITIHAELKPQSYPTAGKPSSVAVTEDGKHLLLTVNGIEDRKGAGIQVFSIESNGQLKEAHVVSLHRAGAQGIVLIPHTHMLAIGLSNAGVAFAPVKDVIDGKAEFKVLPQSERAGSGYMAASPDGQYLYVANEYAKPAIGGVGTVGVIALHPTADGNIHPQAINESPSGNTTPSLALSADGKRLYSLAEVFPGTRGDEVSGSKNILLRHNNCMQRRDGRPNYSGGLYVWDTAKMTQVPASADLRAFQSALKNVVNAACSPVRAVLSKDGKRLYVTSRGNNYVLEMDVAKLEKYGEDPLIRAIPTEGEAPVGLALFNEDKSLIVANSNRFNEGTGTVSVIDLASGKVIQKFKAGEFPRNVVLSPDGKTLYLTEFNSNTLLAIPVQ